MTEQPSNHLPRPVPAHKIDMIRVAAVATIRKELTALEKDAKDALRSQMDPGDSVRAVLPGVGDLGTIYRTADGSKACVVDEPAFRAWVKATRPGEIVESVRDSYVEALLSRADEHGEALVFGPDGKPTGELIPGIEFKPRKGFIACKQTAEQAANVARALQSGMLSTRGQIEAGPKPQVAPAGEDLPGAR